MNVLAIEGAKEKFYILRKSKCDGRRMTNLLLIVNDEKQHYAAIKNMSQLLGSSNGSHGHQQHFCLNCLQGFHSEASRDKHYEYCVENEVVRIDMPEENFFVGFHSGQYQFKVPFAIYADFEAILKGLEKVTKTGSTMKRINYHVLSRSLSLLGIVSRTCP